MCGENTNNRLFLDTRRKQVAAAETFRLVADQLITAGGDGGGEILDVALGRDRSLILGGGGEVWTTAGDQRTPMRIELGRGNHKGKSAAPITVVGISDTMDLAATADGTGKP